MATNRWGLQIGGLVGLVAIVGAVALTSPNGRAAGLRNDGCPRAPKPPVERTISRPRWVSDVLVTEYFPAPESWFGGRKVRAPGLTGAHRIDWLYSARGLAMQGEGIGTDGRLYHFAGPYSLTWRNVHGQSTYPCTHVPGVWTNGSPDWVGTTRLSRDGNVTYRLGDGAWSNGRATRVIPATGQASFAPGASLALSYWHDVAVDPRLIPHGSSIFVRAYCGTPSHGWFVAADTGGAIIGRHIDIFRAPPAIAWDDHLLRDQNVFVVPPGFARPKTLHC